MTERDDHIFDKIIRDKVSPHTEPVPDDIWKNISKKRIFRSFLITNYKLIVSVITLMILGLVVTISMTYKTKTEKENRQQTAIKNPENNVISKGPEKVKKNDEIKQYQKVKSYKAEENRIISEKPVIQNTSPVSAVSRDKSSENHPVKGQKTKSANTIIPQNNDKKDMIQIPDKELKIKDPSPPILTTNKPPLTEKSQINPTIQTISDQPNTDVTVIDKSVHQSSETQSKPRITAEIISDNTTVEKTVVSTHPVIADSNTLKQPENITPPTYPHKMHFNCIDFIFSPGLVSKTTEASNPAFESYARMLDRVTKTRYSYGFEIRYRYYLNPFWNLATGIMYNQINEQLSGQTKPEQISIKQTTGTLITPFDPPKQITITDTFEIAAKTVLQNNTYSFLQIPALLGANFGLFKIPLNIYAGAVYYYSFKQQGAFINSTTLESADFQSSLDNPYKDAQGLSIMAGINASKKISKRISFFIGIDYTRYVISINDSEYQFQQYYSIWDLNLGITYQLF